MVASRWRSPAAAGGAGEAGLDVYSLGLGHDMTHSQKRDYACQQSLTRWPLGGILRRRGLSGFVGHDADAADTQLERLDPEEGRERLPHRRVHLQALHRHHQRAARALWRGGGGAAATLVKRCTPSPWALFIPFLMASREV
jgi:hypothetical protein